MIRPQFDVMRFCVVEQFLRLVHWDKAAQAVFIPRISEFVDWRQRLVTKYFCYLFMATHDLDDAGSTAANFSIPFHCSPHFDTGQLFTGGKRGQYFFPLWKISLIYFSVCEIHSGGTTTGERVIACANRQHIKIFIRGGSTLLTAGNRITPTNPSADIIEPSSKRGTPHSQLRSHAGSLSKMGS